MRRFETMIRLVAALAAAMAIAGCSAIGCNGDETAARDEEQVSAPDATGVTALSAYSPADGEVAVAFSASVYVVGEVSLQTSQGNLPPKGDIPSFADEAESELRFDAGGQTGTISVSGFAGEGGVFDFDGEELSDAFAETFSVSLSAESTAVETASAETPTPEPTATPLPPRQVTQVAPFLPTPTSGGLDERSGDAVGAGGWFEGLTEVVSVTLVGDAGDTKSWFIIGFDGPVTAPRPDETFLLAQVPPGGDDIGLPDEDAWRQERLPLITPALDLADGVTELGFGPVKVEGTYAVEIQGAVEDLDARRARLSFPPTRFTPTRAIGAPIEGELTGCVAVMERRDVSSVIVRLVREEDPAELNDEDLVVWGRLLADEFGIEERRLLEVFEPRMGLDAFDPDLAEMRECRSLWSQPVSVDNGEKRNATYSLGCLSSLGWADPGAPWSARADALELAGRRYDGLSLAERMALRLILDANSYMPMNADGRDSPCRRWYPQLFYGRWIPLEGRNE